MKELLFEIGTEEIPSRLLDRAAGELRETVEAALSEAGLAFEGFRTFHTPRRLALTGLVAEGAPDATRTVTGPPVAVAYDGSGAPTQAALAFARKAGRDIASFERMETPRGTYLGYVETVPGARAAERLPEILRKAASGLSWPKAMRWGTRREPFIRPIHWIVALYGGETLPLEIAGVGSGRLTRGHRFLDPEPFEVRDAESWLDGLRRRHVEPDPEVRRRRVREGADRLAGEVGGVPHLPDALLVEVSGLVEHVVPLRGTFEDAFLEVPPQVLMTSMMAHQRYVPVVKADGSLSHHFVVISGMVVDDPAVVVAGNERVLRARLSDARFFFEEDRKTPLADLVPKLEGRRFLEGLGTMLDKAKRLEDLSRRLAPLFGADPGHAARAGLLAKADLASAMVGEFAELQGEMGRDYARLSGEPVEVADAILEHYLPKGAGDRLPGSAAGKAVSVADKIDSLAGCFALGLEPTGSADPYALRRQALGVLRILEAEPKALAPLPLGDLVDTAFSTWGGALRVEVAAVRARLLEFFRGRMKAAWSQEFPTDLTEAVLEVGAEDVRDARARLAALAALKETAGWEALAIAVKRVANIAGAHPAPARPPEPVGPDETQLWRAIADVAPLVEDAAERRDYAEAVRNLATLGGPLDAFFVAVLVMSPDPVEQKRRLDLLAVVHRLFRRLAAFEKVST